MHFPDRTPTDCFNIGLLHSLVFSIDSFRCLLKSRTYSIFEVKDNMCCVNVLYLLTLLRSGCIDYVYTLYITELH